MHRKVLDTIVRHKLLGKGDRVLVAVSGGPDSVALLSTLLALRERLGVELAVAHLHHGLRGPEADEDEAFVRALAKRHKLRVRCRKVDIASRRRAHGGSLEEVAREARYAFLRAAARDLGANVIATGHTADDNAETLLMNLLRGAGLRGVAGIPICRAEGELRVVRPLLEVTRAEIVEYLDEQGLEYRIDSTNADTDLTRNRIRADLLPQLAQQYNPSVAALLSSTAEQARDVVDLIRAQVERAARRLVEPVENGFALPLRALRQLPRAVRTELARGLIAEHFGRALGSEHVRSLERFLFDPARPQPSIGRGLACEIVFGKLAVRRARRPRFVRPIEVVVPGTTIHPELGVELSARITRRPRNWRRPARPALGLTAFWEHVERGERAVLTQDFDADAALRSPLRCTSRAVGAGPLVLRARQAGDTMQPTGFDGVRKVQDIFVDEKLPAAVRGKVPLLCRGNEVIWIPGYRIGETFKVTDNTERLLVVRLTLLDVPGRRPGPREAASKQD